jgi:hypothetical protein
MGPTSSRLLKARIADYSDLAANLVDKLGINLSMNTYLVLLNVAFEPGDLLQVQSGAQISR